MFNLNENNRIVMAQHSTDMRMGVNCLSDMKVPYIEGGKMTDEGTGSVTQKQPLDVTESLDKVLALLLRSNLWM